MCWNQASVVPTRTVADGEGRADHERRPPGAMAEWGRGELRRLGTSCIVAAPPSHRALAVGGNSEIINRGRAENEVAGRLRYRESLNFTL
jgi:hypothetical protein